jgi:two-component system response regulator FixJ
LLDVRMPGKDGVTVLDEMVASGRAWPTIIMTGHAEVKIAVRAMKLGAIEFLEKPFRDDELIAALDRGWSGLAAVAETNGRRQDARQRLTGLTSRERCVLDGIIGGLSNKEMAIEFGLSHRTVEMHRSNLLRRTRTRKVADLVSLAVAAGYSKPGSPASMRLHPE